MSNQKEQSTELAIGSVIDAQVKNVLATNFQSFNSAFVLSTAIQEIDKALTADNMKPIMALQGKKLGFRTDKVYALQVVKECVIEAVLQGLNVVGNHFNIIAGNMYITKEGYGFLLKQMKDLRYNISFGILEEKNGYTDVQAKITWKREGEEGKKQVETFPVKSGKYGTPDNILGKAERKARKWLYDHISGKETADGAIDIDHTDVTTEMDKGRYANKQKFDDSDFEDAEEVNDKNVDDEHEAALQEQLAKENAKEQQGQMKMQPDF